MGIQSFPPELIDAVFASFDITSWHSGVKDSLRSCRLVCKSWGTRALPYLFFRVRYHLWEGAGASAQSCKTITIATLDSYFRSRPDIAGYVRELFLDVPYGERNRILQTLSSSAVYYTPTVLLSLLRRFLRLETLSLNDVFVTVPRDSAIDEALQPLRRIEIMSTKPWLPSTDIAILLSFATRAGTVYIAVPGISRYFRPGKDYHGLQYFEMYKLQLRVQIGSLELYSRIAAAPCARMLHTLEFCRVGILEAIHIQPLLTATRSNLQRLVISDFGSGSFMTRLRSSFHYDRLVCWLSSCVLSSTIGTY